MEKNSFIDFYFTNSIENIELVKSLFEEHDIPNREIISNNNHPLFGINSTISMDKNLYKYVIQIPEEYVEKADFVVSQFMPEEDEITDEENEIPEEQVDFETENQEEEVEQPKKTKINPGYLFMLLFVSHFSRFFYTVRKSESKTSKKVILNLIAIFLFCITYGLFFIYFSFVFSDYMSGFLMTCVTISSVQTIINFIDSLIEKQKLQKRLFLLFGFITVFLIYFMKKNFIF